MRQQYNPLTEFTEAQRAEALSHFHVLRPFLEDGVPLTQIAMKHELPIRTLRRWVQRYRAQGLLGLARSTRKDKNQRRAVTTQAQQLIEDLALEKPRRTVAAIHREISNIAKERGWKTPSYSTVERIVRQLDPALLASAHEGLKVSREEFDISSQRGASISNELY